MRALGRELPCDAGIPFPPRLRGRGHHGHKQRSRGDLPAYLRIPRIAADEFALVEPYLDAGGAQRVVNALRRHRVLGRVAQENGPIGRSWRPSDMCQWVANQCRAGYGLTRQKQEYPRCP